MLRDWRPELECSRNTRKHKLSAWIYDTPKSAFIVLSIEDQWYQLLPFIYLLVYRSKELSDIYITNLPKEKCLYFLPCVWHLPSPLGVMPLLSAGLTTQ